MLVDAVPVGLVDEFLVRSTVSPDDAIVSRLSGRERAVLAELARGSTNAEIARALVVSPATVKTHVASILAKLGLRDRIQAVILAYETGFIPRTVGGGSERSAG